MFKIKKNKTGQYHFTLQARNGEVIATSEMYKKKSSCLKGIASVKKVAKSAKIVDLTI